MIALYQVTIKDRMKFKKIDEKYKKKLEEVPGAIEVAKELKEYSDLTNLTKEQSESLRQLLIQEDRISKQIQSIYSDSMKEKNECMDELQLKYFKERVELNKESILKEIKTVIPLIIETYYTAGTILSLGAVLDDFVDQQNKAARIKDTMILNIKGALKNHLFYYQKEGGNVKAIDKLIEDAVEKAYTNAQTPVEANEIITQITNSDNPESLESIRPQNIYRANNKLVGTLQTSIILPKMEDGEERFSVDMSKSGAKKCGAELICGLENEGVKIVNGQRPFVLPEYDRDVMDAVSSLWEEGNEQKEFTAEMVYRVMVRDTDTKYIRPNTVERVKESLHRMGGIKVKIDLRDVNKKWKMDRNREVETIEGRLLNTIKIECKINGKPTTVYKMIFPPVLYQLSKHFKQVICYDPELLVINEIDSKGKPLPARIQNTQNMITVRSYLIERINRMKKGPQGQIQTVISLDSIYTRTLEQPTPKRKRSTREKAEVCLKNWKAKKYIKDFQIQRKGKKITGFKIIL